MPKSEALRIKGVEKDLLKLDLTLWASWLSAEDLGMMLQLAAKYPKAGRGLGKMIRMTEAERTEVKAWHLQSIDGPTPEERRQKVGKEGRREQRAAEGKPTRTEYLDGFAGSERRAKPWEALKVGQATYYRYKAAGRLSELHARLLSVIAGSRQTYILAPDCSAPAITPSEPSHNEPVGAPADAPSVGTSVAAPPMPIMGCSTAGPGTADHHLPPGAQIPINGHTANFRAHPLPHATMYNSVHQLTNRRTVKVAPQTAAALWTPSTVARLDAMLATWRAEA